MRVGAMIAAAVAMTAIGVGGHVFGAGQAASTRTAASLLKAARAAIGTDAKIAAVSSLRLRGEQKTLNQLFGRDARARVQFDVAPVELRAQLPDRYLRIREDHFGGGIYLVKTGFMGSELLSTGRNSPSQIDTQHRIFAQFILLVLLRTDTLMPLTLRDGPVTGNTIEFTGANDFHGFLDLDPVSHLPIRLRFKLAMRTMLGDLTGGIEDVMIVVSDFRDAGGLRLPFHDAISEDGELMSETTYQSIEINVPVSFKGTSLFSTRFPH